MTLLGTDRPGLVRVLADLVANHGGNWLDSRMARLAGQFAGIVRIECPEETVESLIEALKYPQLSDRSCRSRENKSQPSTPHGKCRRDG